MNRSSSRAIAPPRTGTPPLVKAAAISLAAFAHKQHIVTELRGWRGDSKGIELLIRAATSPASLTGSNWADTLAMTSVSNFISVLGPSSAGSALLGRGLEFKFDSAAAIVVPTIVAAATNTSFVQEGAPIPVRQLAFSGPRLEPRKFATEVVFTREIFEHSIPTIETTVRATLVESVSLALDQAMFSNSAGDSTRPPGLLQGTALTPSGNADHNQAAIEDAATLAAAVSVVAGNGEIIFVCSPRQATTLRLRTFGFPYLVLASSALTAGTVIAVAANNIASATDERPRFDIGSEGVVQLETAPSQFSTPGTPPTIAAPQISLYQSDLVSLRMVFEMSWLVRSASGLAYMTAVTW